MNLFGKSQYTRFLERELVRARRQHAIDKAQWDEERRQLTNVALLKHGSHAPFVSPAASNNGNRPAPRAVGPWQIHARNAIEEKNKQDHVEETVHAPTLTDDEATATSTPVLSDAMKERIRREAAEAGLLNRPTVPAT